MELEPDLKQAQDKIIWADHMVWIYPVWWSSLPAIMKGFIDRTFLPGFAFQKKPDSLFSEKKLTGKTARLICTLDQPGWYYRLVYRCPSHRAMKKGTLSYVGVRKTRTTTIGPIRLSSALSRRTWLEKVHKLGEQNR